MVRLVHWDVGKGTLGEWERCTGILGGVQQGIAVCVGIRQGLQGYTRGRGVGHIVEWG